MVCFHIIIIDSFQLATSKRREENAPKLYELDGDEGLGSYLRVQPSDRAPELSECSIQWYRLTSEGGKKVLISGRCSDEIDSF